MMRLKFSNIIIFLNSFIAIGLITLPISYLLYLYYFKEMIVCKRESCIERSKFIIATMDSSRDPCQDFYSYACGRWLKNVNFNSNIDRLIPFELMRLKTENNIRFILSNSWDHERNKLNDKIIKSKSISVEWLARMHQQCHNGTEKNFSVRFKKIWNQFIPSRFNLTWPLGYDQSKNLLRFYKNWLDLYADYYKFFGEGTVFEISSFRLEHNRDSILFKTIRFGKRPRSVGEIFRTYWRLLEDMDVIRCFKSQTKIFKENIQNAAKLQSDLEYLFSRIHSKSQIIRLSKLNRIVGNNITRFLNSMRESKDSKSSKNFKIHLWIDSDLIGIDSFNNFVFAIKEFQSKDLIIIANNFYLETFANFIAMNRDGKRDCYQEHFDGNSPLKFAMARIYIDHFLKPKTKLRSIELVNNIKQAAIQMIKEANWLDSETSSRIIHKLRGIIDDIAFPQWILSDRNLDNFLDLKSIEEIPQSYYEMRRILSKIIIKQLFEKIRKKTKSLSSHLYPLLVDAYYQTKMNTIHISSQVLQQPIFDAELPYYLNVGSLGFIVGHEIFHGLDRTGVNHDELGRLRHFWEEKSWNTYLKKTECLARQFSRIKDNRTSMMIDGIRTLNENIADSAGVRTAFKSFKNFQRFEYTIERLPLECEQFTPEQLFFISLAQTSCDKHSIDVARSIIREDNHAPHLYRINVAFQNMKEFASAFQCSPNTPMNNNSNRCIIW
ncbi:Neprilysin-1 [Sarcoptes scabiei]|uniref:Neprilysin-1 n=1 Tax=Sarcoptes scabiei TaxID=52283 RepID=A0A834RDN8_SARSC|nr:Neprilysin-1 [Sarcoptes scabiei]